MYGILIPNNGILKILIFLKTGFDKTKHEWDYNGWKKIEIPTLTKKLCWYW